MSIDDVVKLIEACKNTSVIKLKFEKLEIQFSSDPKEIAVPNSTESQERIENSHQSMYEEDLEDLRVQSLMADDPLAYETEVRNQQYEEENNLRFKRNVPKERTSS